MTEEAWDVVEDAAGLPQAELYRSLLEAEGIPVLLSQEGLGHAMGLTVGPLGLVEVLVPSHQVEAARSILEAYFENVGELPADELAIGDEPLDGTDQDEN